MAPGSKLKSSKVLDAEPSEQSLTATTGPFGCSRTTRRARGRFCQSFGHQRVHQIASNAGNNLRDSELCVR
jgi:hypothetical protein